MSLVVKPRYVRLLANGEQSHRYRLITVLALLSFAVVGGGAAVLQSDSSSPTKVSAAGAASGVVQVSDDPRDLGPAPDGYSGVSDSEGVVRGFISEGSFDRAQNTGDDPMLTFAGGKIRVPGYEVVDGNGVVTGYFLVGRIGFVEESVADDPEQLAKLIADAAEQTEELRELKEQLDAEVRRDAEARYDPPPKP